MALASVSFLTQLNSRLSAGTAIEAVVTAAELPPVLGPVMAEYTGGPVTSEPETAKMCATRGAGFDRLTVRVCVPLVAGVFT